MYCSKCGASIQDEKASKCPQCANHLMSSSIREPIKNRWGLKLFIAAVLLILGAGIVYQNLDNENVLGDVVSNQLTALQNHHVTEAYYHYSSKDFQTNVSLEKFHQWIAKFPVLAEHDSVKLGVPVVEGNKGVIRGVLVSKNNTLATIEAKLTRETEGWKVSKLSVTHDNANVAEVDMITPSSTAMQHSKNINEAPLDTQDALQVVIDAQLHALQQEDYKTAYGKYGSKDFRKITLENFEIYVQQFPIFKSFKTIEVLNEKAGKHQGAIVLLLKNEKESAKVEYYMTNDHDKWEIGDFGVVQYFRNFDLQIEDVKNLLTVVEGQIHALQANDLDKAYHDFTSAQYKQQTSIEAFKKALSAEPVLTRFQGTNLKSINLEESGVVVQVELFDVNNEIFIVECIMGLEGTQWKIWGAQVYAQSDSIGGEENGEVVLNEHVKNK